jgi:hypothetical protein
MKTRWLLSIFLLVLAISACNLTVQPDENLESQAKAWQFIGTNPLNVNPSASTESSLAIDSSGRPVVSWAEYAGITVNNYYKLHIYVKRWNGTSWVQLGGILNVNKSGYATAPSLALDNAGNPVVSWAESAPINGKRRFRIYVKRWNGTSWVQLGGILNVDPDQNAADTSLALDSSGNPVVSWAEHAIINNSQVHYIYAKRWTGSSWVQIGSTLNSDNNQGVFHTTSLALDSSGRPVVSLAEGVDGNYGIHVKRWNGIRWVQLGTTLNVNPDKNAFHPSLALDSSGKPVVSWIESEDSSTSENVYVKRWTGSAWIQLGDRLDTLKRVHAYRPSLALDSSDNPVVSWEEEEERFSFTNYIYVERWTGSHWVRLGTYVDPAGGRAPSLALDNSDNPIVSWDGIGTNGIYVKRYATIAP